MPLDLPMFSDLDSPAMCCLDAEDNARDGSGAENFKHEFDCFRLQDERYRAIFTYTTS